MTITETPAPTAAPLPMVAVDLYRDIHKGIRSELFAITEGAGRLDPSDPAAVGDLAAHVGRVVELLVSHADHEDTHIQPALEQHLPTLADQVAEEHGQLEVRIARLAEQAEDLAAAPADRRADGHRLYLDLAAFTGSYLAHQDLEERVIMPALEAVVGPEVTLGLHQAIVGSIPPEEMARSLALMLPAMNVEDRTELLGGMRAGAPAEVFAGVWSLAGSVLDRRDHDALAVRLGL